MLMIWVEVARLFESEPTTETFYKNDCLLIYRLANEKGNNYTQNTFAN